MEKYVQKSQNKYIFFSIVLKNIVFKYSFSIFPYFSKYCLIFYCSLFNSKSLHILLFTNSQIQSRLTQLIFMLKYTITFSKAQDI